MFILGLHFNAHTTLRVEEIAGAFIALAGAALFLGGMMPLSRRFGSIVGGICLAIAGVLSVLAVRYGVRP
jgi:hypothetical protein